MNTSGNKALGILKWVGIALAVLSTVFTLVIVGSHLSGRLIGMGKIGIIGAVGAELMCIICAWLLTTDNKRVVGVAMICQIVLTAVLLVNASIAMDLDWQESLANKATEHQMAAQRLAAEEERKLIEKKAELAGQLAQQDKRLAREFVKSGKSTAKLPASSDSTTQAEQKVAPLDISKMSVYERYGLTVVPLFLALLTVIALGVAAHSGETASSYSDGGAPEPSRGGSGGMGFAPPQSTQLSPASRQTISRTANHVAGKDWSR